ncbi:LamG-like jellyroll fold domain-containing protein [Paenibacillus sp. Soil724D2]|uniref:LamG-like jellyroll fold domain-containing protein n=1 Tax=Paenibacillus sp. (strain Soil724D2) TaxID=1736392 RepID=UPI000713133E|nr:LamG-like jellyroll fold domain-containing protein [Paenibacillus sp. Soil724D2]KRE33442.1 hypothetical protein ASG85_14340 [Paenibacillus sp. Soil724D2]
MGIVTDGLVAYYHYKQGVNGATWNNIAPANVGKLNGAIAGAVLQANGMYFDGLSGTKVTVLNDPLLQITNNITIEVIFSSDTLAPRTSLLHKNYNGEYSLVWETTGGLNAYWGTTATLYNVHGMAGVNAATLTTGTFRRNLAATTAGWVKNGIPYSSIADTKPTARTTTGDLLIGNGYVAGFKGIIVAVRIYNRALSDAEVAQNYAVGNEVGLVASKIVRAYDGGIWKPAVVRKYDVGSSTWKAIKMGAYVNGSWIES